MNPSLDGPIWLGIDVGTQSVRALAVSGNGETLGSGSQKLTSDRDGGRHEQDPEEWWKAVALACRQAVADLPAERIAGVAVDGTSGTILFMDEAGQPLTRGLMYDDTRATAEVARVNEAGAALWNELGYHKMQAAWGLPKLLWLLRESAAAATQVARFAHQTDFINRRLVGTDVATDTSNALKSGCDLIRTCWPHEVFGKLGIPLEILPPIVSPGSRLGRICAAAARESGIPEGTPVFAGMTDGCASQIGAGALSPGSWNSVLGTTLVLKGSTPQLIKDPADILYSHRSPDGSWLPGGASSTGAGVISKEFGGRDLEELTSSAAAYEPAGAVVYPLAGRGERFPFHCAEAEGFTLGTTKDDADRFAALLQGVAFVERLCFDYLDLLGAPIDGDLLLTGGGARSGYWSQLRSDVLGRSVKLPENPAPALGMAVLAAASGRTVAQAASEMVRIREVIDPRPDRIGRFAESYLRLVDELSRRGWLPAALAAHAGNRISR